MLHHIASSYNLSVWNVVYTKISKGIASEWKKSLYLEFKLKIDPFLPG